MSSLFISPSSLADDAGFNPFAYFEAGFGEVAGVRTIVAIMLSVAIVHPANSAEVFMVVVLGWQFRNVASQHPSQLFHFRGGDFEAVGFLFEFFPLFSSHSPPSSGPSSGNSYRS